MENNMNLHESIRNDLNKLNESNDFFKYVESFYGDGGIYARYFTNDDGSEGASIEEITKAIDVLTNDDKWSWGGGDSMDREKVRDIMLSNRETDHDAGLEQYDEDKDVINFKSKEITNHQVEQWLGSDIGRKGIIEILRDIANGDYPAEMLKRDITSYE